MLSKEYERKIVEYYDDCQIDYEWAWHLKTRMSMHYGYWDETTEKLRQALTNMNRHAAAFGQIKEGDKVLDAGCGVGGSSIYLAQHFNCTTVGITLSEKQVQTCRENASKHDVADQCTFEVQSFLNTSFADNTFDVVWAMESVCHAPDKAVFLKEAFRVLKPGGRIIVADFYGNNIDEAHPGYPLLDKWAKSWAIESFADKDGFWNSLEATGFEARDQKDVTPNIENTVKKLYKAFFFGLPVTIVSQLVGFRNRTQGSNVMSAYYQYHSYYKQLWKYIFFTARKPGAE